MTLSEYTVALPKFCEVRHHAGCTMCPSLLKAAQMILKDGVVSLADAFKSAFPGLAYKSSTAKRMLLQMPLVAVRMGDIASGTSQVHLIEYLPGVDYTQLQSILHQFHSGGKPSSNPVMTRADIKDLLQLAQSNRERGLLRYAVYKASGLSATAARRHFGFEGMKAHTAKVNECIEEAQAIREAVEQLAEVQEEATLASLGIVKDTESSSTSSSEPLDSMDESTKEGTCREGLEKYMILNLLHKSCYNWFEFVEQLESKHIVCNSELMEKIFCEVLPVLSESQQALVKQSYGSFCYDRDFERPQEEREAAVFNSEIVSESENDDPDELQCVRHLESEEGRSLVKKKIAAVHRRARRVRAKAIAERNFLGYRSSKKVRGILKDYPNIGTDIEDYVKERSVGADAWRRTGVLTFDGNKQVKEKVTYSNIRLHLEELYQRKFSYGTVVQLCVARNKRRRSAARYKGVAKVTTRRARKGFTLKYNPDSHWSAALYRGLNYLQYTDGRNIMNLNRDDCAGFRLDTLSTHRLHRTPVVKGHEILATHTDFVNSYPSLLHTTSYNFSKTQTSGEICVGVVKGAGAFPKNPAQHAADLQMLCTQEEVKPAFSTAGGPKLIECIRVDGGSDEGPSHLEVQFWWTLRHIEAPTLATLITTRNSGSSYLNRVELQNGCLACAHANLFIPSN